MMYNMAKDIAGLLLALLLALASPAAPAQETGPAFEEFELVLTRNIFNPNRQPAQVEAPDRRDEKPYEPPPATDYITLLGVFIDMDEAVAFFAGSQYEYSRSAQRGETIAGFEIAKIRTDVVSLTGGVEPLELAVGAGLSSQDGGPWRLVDEPWRPGRGAPDGMGEAVDSDLAAKTDGTASEKDVSASDMLKKLMERRKKELE